MSVPGLEANEHAVSTQAAGIFVRGWGAVSPAGWGVARLREALERGEPATLQDLPRPGWQQSLHVRQVPRAASRPQFANHPRLRRTSPVAQYMVAAALEALGAEAGGVADGQSRLGVIFCAMTGCVNYSRRFYDEVLKDPGTASPLVFPETVYNSPASHLAALLNTTAVSYTLVGDPGVYLQGLALAADWLTNQRVDGCLVVGAEEMDWLNSDAMRLFRRGTIISEGSGALYLRREPDRTRGIRLRAISSPHLFSRNSSRARAAELACAELQLPGPSELLCDSRQGIPLADRDEDSAWKHWACARLSPKAILGEGFMAAAAWQCVAAVDALEQNRYDAATVSVVGCNQQAIAARFTRT